MKREELEKRIAHLRDVMKIQENLVSMYNAKQAAIKVVNNGG